MARSKDTSQVTRVVEPVPYAALEEALLSPKTNYGPRSVGIVEMIVLRPDINLRQVVPEAVTDVEHGVHGSGWVLRPERGLIDQVCVMSTTAIRAIAGDDRNNWPPAGDNIFVDMNLSKKNLPEGTKVRIGNVEAYVTKKPHNGCPKFSKRYGIDALKLVNSPRGKQLRLRGIYFAVVTPGVIRQGDEIVKITEPRKSSSYSNFENLEAVVQPVPFDVLSKTLLGADAPRGPTDNGRVDLIVLRPAEGEREVVLEAVVTLEQGIHGSGWAMAEKTGLRDQVCVMSSSAIRAMAGADKRNWPPAGDNLFVDMDLSKTNLPPGTKVRVGTAEAVISQKPHMACSKFSKRYGPDALKVVNGQAGRDQRLRGVYLEVVAPGIVKEGDHVVKL